MDDERLIVEVQQHEVTYVPNHHFYALPVGMDAGQRTQPFRGAAVPRRIRVRWNPGVRALT